jgi:hypothetical protein
VSDALRDGPEYVALGDSISIDEYTGGPGRGGASLLFRNLDDDFPQWRGRDLSHCTPTRASRCWRRTARRPAPSPTCSSRGSPAWGPADARHPDGGRERRAVGVRRQHFRASGHRSRAVRGRPGARRGDGSARSARRIVVGTVYDPSHGTGDARLGLPPWPEAVAVIADLNEALRKVAHASGAAVAEIAQRIPRARPARGRRLAGRHSARRPGPVVLLRFQSAWRARPQKAEPEAVGLRLLRLRCQVGRSAQSSRASFCCEGNNCGAGPDQRGSSEPSLEEVRHDSSRPCRFMGAARRDPVRRAELPGSLPR